MVNITVINENIVKIELIGGKMFTVTTDDNSAVQLALKLTDWSDKFDREDRAEEVTQIMAIVDSLEPS